MNYMIIVKMNNFIMLELIWYYDLASTLATFSNSSLQKTDLYSPSVVLENMS